MRLVEPFEYIDSNRRHWPVPSGTETDGASIPQFFWSIIGGPFEGPYRDASVVHDYYCQTRTRRWQDVHAVFYDAMLTNGVGNKKAWLMYQAVEKFGPQWDEPKLNPDCLKPNGKIDFERCSENKATVQNALKWPSARRTELLEFLKEVETRSDPNDIATLTTAAQRMKE